MRKDGDGVHATSPDAAAYIPNTIHIPVAAMIRRVERGLQAANMVVCGTTAADGWLSGLMTRTCSEQQLSPRRTGSRSHIAVKEAATAATRSVMAHPLVGIPEGS